MKTKERKVIYIRVAPKLKKELEKRAIELDKSLSDLCRYILRSYIESSRQDGAS